MAGMSHPDAKKVDSSGLKNTLNLVIIDVGYQGMAVTASRDNVTFPCNHGRNSSPDKQKKAVQVGGSGPKNALDSDKDDCLCHGMR